MNANSHVIIRQALEERIVSGEWALGVRIPDEIELAQEYGCARTTVNRALRSLAEDGLVIRKRKGGTRVNPTPVRQAKVEIPILREQIEAMDGVYAHHVLRRKICAPPSAIRKRLNLAAEQEALNLETLYLTDDKPFAFEVRWININKVPDVVKAPLDRVSANEWLVQTVPFSSGDVMFSAMNANKRVASVLGIQNKSAVFVVERTTWLGKDFITTMKLFYREGYQLYSTL